MKGITASENKEMLAKAMSRVIEVISAVLPWLITFAITT
jgi:hypothetical protein